jgi:hypothetical protein
MWNGMCGPPRDQAFVVRVLIEGSPYDHETMELAPRGYCHFFQDEFS